MNDEHMLPRRYPEDPGPVLEAAFERIHRERMQGLPLLNPALRVQAVDFELHEGNWVGVLLTPWFLEIVLLPGPDGEWPATAVGAKRRVALPSGEYRFSCGHEDSVGPYLFCSLMSPVKALASQSQAVGTAREVMDLLLEAPAQTAGSGPTPRAVSRRGFLRVEVAPARAG